MLRQERQDDADKERGLKHIADIIIPAFFIIFFALTYFGGQNKERECDELFGEEWDASFSSYSCHKLVTKEQCIEGTDICKNRTVEEYRSMNWVDKE